MKIKELKDISEISNFKNITEYDSLFISSNYRNKLNDFINSLDIEIDKYDFLNAINGISDEIHIVFIGENNAYKTIAQYFAKTINRELLQFDSCYTFIENFNLNSYKNTTFIFIVDENNREELQTELSNVLTKITFGVLCARSAAELLFIIAKMILTFSINIDNTIFVDRTDMSSTEIIKNTKITYIPRTKASKEAIFDSMKSTKKLSNFTLLGHGRDELVWLTNGILCCRKDSDIKNDSSESPSCVQCDVCFKDNVAIWDVSEFPAINIFMNACCSGKMSKAVFGDNYNLMFGFMNNYAATYIGTPYLAQGVPAINNYYIALLLSGFSLGKIVNLINNYYVNYKFGAAGIYFLYGSPLLRCYSNIPVTKINMNEAIDSYKFSTNINSCLIEIIYPLDIYDDFINYRKEVIVRNDNNDKIFANMFSTEDHKHSVIHIFSDHILEPSNYYLSVKDRDDSSIYSIRNADYLVELGFCDSKIKNYYYESINSCEIYLNDSQIKLSRIDNLGNSNYSKRDKLTKRIDTLSQRIVEKFTYDVHKKGLAFDEACLQSGFFQVDRKYKNEKCPYCNQDLTDNIIINPFFNRKRLHKYCSKCGNIFDGPYNSEIYIEFDKNYTFNSSNSVGKISVYVYNYGNIKQFGYLSVAISTGVQNDFNFIPQMYRIEIDSKSQQLYSFEFTCSNIKNHNYWLMANAMINSEMYSIKKDIFFRREF